MTGNTSPPAWLAGVMLSVAVARTSFRQQLAYRGAALGGMVTNAVFGALLCSVYIALFSARGGSAIGGFDNSSTLTFVWLGQALIMPVMIWGSWDIAQMIRTGDIVSDLLKPYSFFGYWLSRDLGRAAAMVLMRAIPTFLIGWLFYALVLPGQPARWFGFALSVLLAVMLSFSLRFCFQIIAFWWTDIQGLRSTQTLIVNFFSGFLLPIAFYPGWLRPLMNVLPFRGMMMSPIDVWLGNGNALILLLAQAAWLVVMLAAASLLFRLAVRKVVVQGG